MKSTIKSIIFFALFIPCFFLIGCTTSNNEDITKKNLSIGNGLLEITKDPSSYNVPDKIYLAQNSDPDIYKYKFAFILKNNGVYPEGFPGEKIKGKICLISPTAPSWTLVDGATPEDLCANFEFYKGIKNDIVPEYRVILPTKGFIKAPTSLKVTQKYSISIVACYTYANIGWFKTCVFSDEKAYNFYSKKCKFSYAFSKGPLKVDYVKILSPPIKTENGGGKVIIEIKVSKNFNPDPNTIYEFYPINENLNAVCEGTSKDLVSNISAIIKTPNGTVTCTAPLIGDSTSILCAVPFNIEPGLEYQIVTFPILLKYIVKEKKNMGFITIYPPGFS